MVASIVQKNHPGRFIPSRRASGRYRYALDQSEMTLSDEQKRQVTRFADETQGPSAVFAVEYGTRILMAELALVRAVIADAVHIMEVGIRHRQWDQRCTRTVWRRGLPKFKSWSKEGRKWCEVIDWFFWDPDPERLYSFEWCMLMLHGLTEFKVEAGRLRTKLAVFLLEGMGCPSHEVSSGSIRGAN